MILGMYEQDVTSIFALAQDATSYRIRWLTFKAKKTIVQIKQTQEQLDIHFFNPNKS